MSEPQRLHPFSIFILILDFIKKSWRDLLPAFIGIGIAGSKWINPWFIVPVVLFGMFIAILYWWRFTFSVQDEQLIIQKGIFSRTSVQIPKQKVQVMDTQSSLLQQFFGLETLSIETAGTDENAKLIGIKADVSTAIQEALRTTQKTEVATQELIVKQPVVQASYSLSNYQLFVHAISSKSVTMIMIAVFYALQFWGENDGNEEIKNRGKEVILMIKDHFLAAIGLFLFFSLIVAVVYSFVRYFNFSLTVSNGDLLISHGLFEKKKQTIPIKRIQSFLLAKNPILALFGQFRLFIESAGSSARGGMGTFMILPVLKRELFQTLFEETFTNSEFPSFSVRPPLRALSKFLRRALFFPVFIYLIARFFVGFSDWWAFSLLIFFPLGWLSYRFSAIGISRDFVCVRRRLFIQEEAYLPIKRIQSIQMHQSWFQKRAGLASLTMHTKTGAHKRSHSIHYLNTEDVRMLKQEILEKILARKEALE